MSVRLSFDLDGTVADLHTALERQVARLFPELELGESNVDELAVSDVADSPSPETQDDYATDVTFRRLTDVQRAALWTHVEGIPDFWTTLDELVPGSLARLAALAQDRRWEILFVTTRPPTVGETVQT